MKKRTSFQIMPKLKATKKPKYGKNMKTMFQKEKQKFLLFFFWVNQEEPNRDAPDLNRWTTPQETMIDITRAERKVSDEIDRNKKSLLIGPEICFRGDAFEKRINSAQIPTLHHSLNTLKAKINKKKKKKKRNLKDWGKTKRLLDFNNQLPIKINYYVKAKRFSGM